MRREPYFYSETVLAADIARVERFYQTEGYLGVEIAPPVPASAVRESRSRSRSRSRRESPSACGPSRASGTSPGAFRAPPPIRRRAARRRPETGYFEGSSGKRAGSRDLGEQAVSRRRALRRLEAHEKQLAEHGYPYTVITHELAVSPEAHAADVTWKLSPGPRAVSTPSRCRAREAPRQGDSPSGRFRERRSVRRGAPWALPAADIQPGDALVRYGQGGPERLARQRRSVAISVREAPRLTARVGAGYGNEDGIRLFAEVRKLGLFGARGSSRSS